MAHQSNVIPVSWDFHPADDRPEKVTDPVCGKEMDRKSARNVLFRGEQTYYFCSKECQGKFIAPAAAKKPAA